MYYIKCVIPNLIVLCQVLHLLRTVSMGKYTHTYAKVLSQNVKNIMKVYNLVGLMSSYTYLCDLFHSQKALAVHRERIIFMYDVIFTILFYSFVLRTTNIITIVWHYYFISWRPSWNPHQYPSDDKSLRKSAFSFMLELLQLYSSPSFICARSWHRI